MDVLAWNEWFVLLIVVEISGVCRPSCWQTTWWRTLHFQVVIVKYRTCLCSQCLLFIRFVCLVKSISNIKFLVNLTWNVPTLHKQIVYSFRQLFLLCFYLRLFNVFEMLFLLNKYVIRAFLIENDSWDLVTWVYKIFGCIDLSQISLITNLWWTLNSLSHFCDQWIINHSGWSERARTWRLLMLLFSCSKSVVVLIIVFTSDSSSGLVS